MVGAWLVIFLGTFGSWFFASWFDRQSTIEISTTGFLLVAGVSVVSLIATALMWIVESNENLGTQKLIFLKRQNPRRWRLQGALCCLSVAGACTAFSYSTVSVYVPYASGIEQERTGAIERFINEY